MTMLGGRNSNDTNSASSAQSEPQSQPDNVSQTTEPDDLPF